MRTLKENNSEILMRTLKENNSEILRPTKIVILPSDEKNYKVKQLCLKYGKLILAPWSYSKGELINIFQPQYLYLLSTEHTPEGAWCFEMHNGESLAENPITYIDEIGNKWYLRQMNMNCSANDPECLKIISSTNPALNLPNLPEQFLREYIDSFNRNDVIDTCHVVYETRNEFFNNDPNHCYEVTEPKVTNGEITIRKVKDSYSKEDVREKQFALLNYLGIKDDEKFTISNFIEQNL